MNTTETPDLNPAGHNEGPDAQRTLWGWKFRLWCRENRIEDTPFLHVRVDELTGTYATVQFLERKMSQENGPEAAPETERKLAAQLALVEALGKARERLRKAMREFQEDFVRTTPSMELGIADLMKPLLKKTEGVLEDALEFERKKKLRLARKRNADTEE